MTTLFSGPVGWRTAPTRAWTEATHQIGAADQAHIMDAEVWAWSKDREPPPPLRRIGRSVQR
jgi:hypothetical protein